MKTQGRKLLVVGHRGLTHLGESFVRVAGERGLPATLVDMGEAERAPRLVRSAAWRLLGKRPPRLGSFSKQTVETVRREQPTHLLATGAAPLTAAALREIGRLGICRINVSTDDPWNPVHRAGWFLEALPHYDAVFTPRRAQVAAFGALGVPMVRYLPFGYDPAHCIGPDLDGATRARLACDVLFVGGADPDRAGAVSALARAGLGVATYGGYWDRYAVAGADWRGHVGSETIRQATLAARVVLVLVRRANRDEHTMRSLEAAATGACLLAEDTPDHRALYGDDGAVFFRKPEEMVVGARALLADPRRRAVLAGRVCSRIRGSGHTYSDRLSAILDAA